jgi:hypothetical protein
MMCLREESPTVVTTWSEVGVGSQTGNNIGSGIVNSIQYQSGHQADDAIYNVYLADIKMTGATRSQI